MSAETQIKWRLILPSRGRCPYCGTPLAKERGIFRRCPKRQYVLEYVAAPPRPAGQEESGNEPND